MLDFLKQWDHYCIQIIELNKGRPKVKKGKHFIPDMELDMQVYKLLDSVTSIPEEAQQYLYDLLPESERQEMR